MGDRHGAQPTRHVTPLAALGGCLALGAGWFVIEHVQLLAAGGGGPDEVLRKGARLLPAQILLFVLLGAVLAAVAAWIRLPRAAFAWLATGAASALFLVPRVAAGLARTSTPAGVAAGVLFTVAAIAVVLALVALAGRALPARVRASWPAAACAGFAVAIIGFTRRAGAALGIGELDATGALQVLQAGDGIAAVMAAAAVLLILAGGRLRIGALSCLALGALWLARPGALPAANATRSPDRPDIVMILIDTLRADHVFGDGRAVSLTPALDRLAEESVVFTRAYSPSNLTRRAMPGVLSSLSVNVTGQTVAPEAQMLPELLRDAGYTRLGISANPFVSAQFNYDQGFDRLVDPSQSSDFAVVGLLQLASVAAPGLTYRGGLIRADAYYRDAVEIRRFAERALSRARGPTFLYLHIMDPHGPYLPPRSYLDAGYQPGAFYSYYRFLRLAGRGVLATPGFEAQLSNLRQRYAGEVRHTDAELGRLFDTLRAAGRLDEMLVWILSDHGEAFGEHDHAGHGGPDMMSTLTRVPLLLKPPRSWGIAPRRIETPVSTYDVLPTTLALLGRTWPEGVFGADLSPLLHGAPLDARPPIVAENTVGDQQVYSCVEGPWRLTVRYSRKSDAPRERSLFDVERDPDELDDLSASHVEVADALQERIEAHRRAEAAQGLREAEHALDPQTEQQLRGLGYLP